MATNPVPAFLGKETTFLPDTVSDLLAWLDLDQVIVERPQAFIFFCGGALSSPRSKNCNKSLRDYLLNERRIGRRLRAGVVLAETANQLYRDSGYADLISFEEDIAAIAALVLIIAESPGSFAELGAFGASEETRKSLSVIVQQKYETQESFIRFGPIEKIKKSNSKKVAFYPWRLRASGTLIKSSAYDSVGHIIQYINARVDESQKSSGINSGRGAARSLVLYWIVFLSQAIQSSRLVAHANVVASLSGFNNYEQDEVKRLLYCMKVAGWIKSETYSDVEYFYVSSADDPAKYYFKPTAVENDALRWKARLAAAFQAEFDLPKHIRTQAAAARVATA